MQGEIPVSRRSGLGKKWARLLVLAMLLLVLTGGGLLVLNRLRGRTRVAYQKGHLYLRSGNAAAAAEQFRAVLARYPDNRESFEGLVQALAQGREFTEAEAELDKAAQVGISEAETALMRARLLSLRAETRLRAAGRTAGIDVFDKVLTDDLEPAIAMVQEHADQVDQPVLAYQLLGKLHTERSDVLAFKRRELVRGAELARSRQRNEEVAQKETQARDLSQAVLDARASAVRAYGKAVELAPDLPEPRLEIAQIYLAQMWRPNVDRIRSILEPVLAQHPGHYAARRVLAVAEWKGGNYDGALEQIDAIGEGEGEGAAVELLYLRTVVLVAAKRWDEAAPLSEQLLKLQPQNRKAVYLRSMVLLALAERDRQNGQDDAARQKCSEAADRLQNALAGVSDPGPVAWAALGRALRGMGNREQAITAFQRVVRDVPDASVSDAQSLQELREAAYVARLALAQELKADSPSQAAEHAQQALVLFPGRPEAFAAAGAAGKAAGFSARRMEDLVLGHTVGLLAQGDAAATLAVCNQAVEDSTDPDGLPRVRLLRARLLARTGSYQEAVQAYEELRPGFADKRPAYELAVLQARLGHLADARRVYDELLQEEPGDVTAMAGLAGVLVREGDLGAARALLEKAHLELGSDGAQALLIDLAVREGQMDEAVKLATSLADAAPDDPQRRAFLARLLWEAGRLEEARAAFDVALERKPDFVPAYVRGLLDVQLGRSKDAIELFETARELFPTQAAPVVYLALALQADGQAAEAAGLLEEVLKEPRARSLLGGLLYWHLAVLEAGRGDAETALAHNDRVAQNELGTRQDRRNLLTRLAAEPEGRRQEAAVVLNTLLEVTRANCLQATMEAIRKLDELLPGEPLVACWRASALDRQGHHEEAVAAYQGVIGAHEDLAFPRLLLAQSHTRAGDVESATAVLQQALAHAADEYAGAIHLQLGQLHQSADQVESAIADYRAASRDPAVAPIALNNLAYLLATAKGDPAAALPLAEQAVKLGGSFPAGLDTLGWVHLLAGNVEQAVELLEQARAGLPALPTVRYHLGMAYLAVGRREEARSELAEALALSQTFPEAADAQAALAGLGE